VGRIGRRRRSRLCRVVVVVVVVVVQPVVDVGPRSNLRGRADPSDVGRHAANGRRHFGPGRPRRHPDGRQSRQPRPPHPPQPRPSSRLERHQGTPGHVIAINVCRFRVAL